MPVVLVGLLILLYHLCILPFALDVLQDIKKYVIPCLTQYLPEFGVSGCLLSTEHFLTKSADEWSESFVQLIPPKEWNTDPILFGTAKLIWAVAVVFTILVLIRRVVFTVRSWNHLLKEIVQLQRRNTILEETCRDLRWKLDLTENDEEAVQREQTSHKWKSLEDAYEIGMNTEEQVASLHRVFEPILEEMQCELDVHQQELAQERTRWSQKEAKMRAESTALEEMMKSTNSSNGVKMISEEEDICDLEEKINALHVENTELMGKINTIVEEETTLLQQENAFREMLAEEEKKKKKKGKKSKQYLKTLKIRLKGFQRRKKTAESSHKS